jgi:predicted PurR-regulated permease PerM
LSNSPDSSLSGINTSSLACVAYSLIIAAITLTLIQIGQTFLIPLVLAVLSWSLLNALSDHILKIRVGPISLPRWMATLLSITTLGLFLLGIYQLLASQAISMAAAGPVYQENFSRLLSDLMAWSGIEQLPSTDSMFQDLNIGSILSLIGGSVGNIFSTIVLVVIYTGFLFAEQNVIPSKLAALHSNTQDAEKTRQVFTEIASQVQRYVWIKTLVSLLTGILSYVVLKLVGVDFAAMWALLIFLLNYIPNIGSILGVIFPALLTLVQFDTLTPFLLITLGLGSLQFIIGNVIEPAFMGKSLNLSSFVIILSLTFWGLVWGIPGMFLSVPIMVVIAIICSRFKGLRRIAVILSADVTLLTPDKHN